MRVLCPVVCFVLLAALVGCQQLTRNPFSVDLPPVPTWPAVPAAEPERTTASRASSQPGEPPTTPILRLETGMHTEVIKRLGVDAAQRYLVTGSDDKTVRVWELASGRLLHTLRPPLGAGNEGKIYAVALSPDGSTIAAAGYTGEAWDKTVSIYLFDQASGRLRQRLTGLPETVKHLAYSRDGTFLVATLGRTYGMRVYRSTTGAEVARDTEYGDQSYGADFDPSGRLVTTSWDGFVRLYDRDFRLRVKRKAPGGQRPFAVAFSHDGSRVAVGFADSTRVNVLSGQDLTPLYASDTTGVDNGNLSQVVWSADGKWLYAAGSYQVRGTRLIRRWTAGGQGLATNLPAAQNTIFHLLPLGRGGVVFGAADPAWGVLNASGQLQRLQGPATADFRNVREGFQLTSDGTTVQFGYEVGGKAPARFAVRDRVVTLDPAPDRVLAAPVTTAPGLEIRDWRNSTTPRLNGIPLKLEPSETSFSLAIAPDSQRFLLGTEFSLRLFDRHGAEQWQVIVPGIAWSVNIAGSGQVAAAACGDGTIRWYRLRDGQELLAFFPHKDRKRWVLWTLSGYYDASPGAEELIGWHVNRGRAQEADFFSAEKFRAAFYRPDVITRVLDTLDEAAALRLANTETKQPQKAVALQQWLSPVVQILIPQDSAMVSTSQIPVRVKELTQGRQTPTTTRPPSMPDFPVALVP